MGKGGSPLKHLLMQGKSSCTIEGNAISGRGLACKAHNCWLPEALLLGGTVGPQRCIEPCEEESGAMVPALEEEAPLMLEKAGDGNVRKEKKEKHKKEKKHKHKHKHKSGHKRHRDDEDAAEVENVHAAVKPHSAEPETRANGKATHDFADKGGSDCESGEIPTAEDDRGEALESTPAGKPAEASRTTGRSLEAADQQSNGASTRCGSVSFWTMLHPANFFLLVHNT